MYISLNKTSFIEFKNKKGLIHCPYLTDLMKRMTKWSYSCDTSGWKTTSLVLDNNYP